MSLLTVEREGAGTPFLWLHGFTQTRHSAREFRSILAGGREVWTVDLPGHGTASAVSASLDESADLIAAAIGPDPVDLGGYSMGARVSLHLALHRPDLVGRLVLLGATRGIRDPDERARRRRIDEERAARIERVGVPDFLSEWLSQPLFARLGSRAELDERSTSGAGLADSLRRAGTGTQQWLGGRLGSLDRPVLALAGALDEKFAAEARAIAEGVPDGRWELVPDAGHAAHLEQPSACARLISTFLND